MGASWAMKACGFEFAACGMIWIFFTILSGIHLLHPNFVTEVSTTGYATAFHFSNGVIQVMENSGAYF